MGGPAFQAFCKGDIQTQNEIYQDCYPVVRAMILKNQGQDADAEDIFQEGLMVLWQYCDKDGFLLSVTIKTFLYSICKNIWLKNLKKKRRLLVTIIDTWEYINVDKLVQHSHEDPMAEQFRALVKNLGKLNDKQRKLIEMYYMDKKSLEEITQEMGFLNTDSAKSQKSKILRILRNLFRGDEEFK
jgi:RNA polymerase sigma factor (sigma-70 family)